MPLSIGKALLIGARASAASSASDAVEQPIRIKAPGMHSCNCVCTCVLKCMCGSVSARVSDRVYTRLHVWCLLLYVLVLYVCVCEFACFVHACVCAV